MTWFVRPRPIGCIAVQTESLPARAPGRPSHGSESSGPDARFAQSLADPSPAGRTAVMPTAHGLVHGGHAVAIIGVKEAMVEMMENAGLRAGQCPTAGACDSLNKFFRVDYVVLKLQASGWDDLPHAVNK